jgi:hypothetical protein
LYKERNERGATQNRGELGGFGGLGVDGDAEDLGEAFFDAVFEGGGDVMDASDGEIAFDDAMTRDEDVLLDLADADIVAVEEFVVLRGQLVEEGIDGEFELTHFAGACVGGGDVAAEGLDVDVDVNVASAEGADAVFEFGGAAMGFAEAEIFVNLEMQLDEEVAILLGSGEIVDGEAEALGDGANGLEEVLVARGARFGVNDDVGGNDLGDALFDGVGEGVNLLEAGGAGHGDGGVNEMAIAGAADADAFDFEDAVHAAHSGGDFALETLGSDVEEGVQGAAAELRANPDDDGSNAETGESVGVGEARKIPSIAHPD